jgi:hypothetical protein
VILLELAAQGVRGVAPAGGRATLRPGYNVIAADGAALRRLLEALLYPDARDAEALPRAPGGPAGAAVRAGLTLVGNDRVTYRLVRDFAAGCQLHRFNPEKRAFALVAQELADVRRVLLEVGIPPRSRLAPLLALSAAELPSRQGAAPPQAGGAPPQRQALAPEQARRRIAQLEGELEKARVAEKLQRELDALHARLTCAEDALRGGEQLREGLERALAARAELDGAAEAGALLGDVEARIAAFERASARREEARAKVEAERAAFAETEARGAPRDFWRDPLFWPAPAVGALLAIGGALGAASGSESRHVALLAVPAFGWGAWQALQWVGALEAWDRVARRRRIVDEWEKKALDGTERDATDVRAAMKAVGASSAAELRDAVSRVADADAVVAEWRRRLADWEASPEAQAAVAERADAEAAQSALEARLASEVGGFVRDSGSIEQEIRRLQAEARAPSRPQAIPAPATAPATSPWKAGDDPLRALLEQAGGETGVSPAAAARAVAARASQALAGLSFQRLQSVQPDERGGLIVQSGGRPAAAASLSMADRDLVFLSVKLALVEQALAGGKVVALADDAFAGLSDGARRFAARLLKQIAKPGQLVHATTDPAFREAADHAA